MTKKRKRGRPFATVTKVSISIRLRPETLDAYRKTWAQGWQTQMSADLDRLVEQRRGGGRS